MEYDAREISNAVVIDSLDAIIERENWKLQMDKTTGLLAEIQSKVEQLSTTSEKVTKNRQIVKDSVSHSPKLSRLCNQGHEIERLANLFTRSPGFFTTNANNNRADANHSQVSLKEKTVSPTHNELDKNLQHYENNKTLISPEIKVRRNVRFGEFSPHNPANQMNSQPFLGIGEYDDKKKKILELQRKEYIDYISKAKHEKNMSDLPKIAAFSCEEAFKTAMETNDSEQNKLNTESMNNQENKIQLVSHIDGIESCVLDEERLKETNRLRQELYRLELSKQIEEKKRLDEELKHREQMEDLAIEKAAKDQEEKLKKEFEKESEKRTLAQLQKQLAQEKLKNELIKKQRELAATERISRRVLKHVSSHQLSLDDDDDEDIPLCPSTNSTFDDAPLPTSRIRAPRKIDYRDIACNTDTFNNPCMNQNIPLPLAKPKTERAHVTFASDPPLRSNVHNTAALLPVTKSIIIDSPLTLALAGLNNDDETCEAIEPTEAVYRNQSSKGLLPVHDCELPTDKHLLSNLGNIRKQLYIDHQRLKAQVRKS